MNIIVADKQSLFDIALICCGDAADAISIAINNGISLTGDIVIGEVLQIEARNNNATRYYAANNIQPATAVAEKQLTDEGIEHWAVEHDFVVS